MIFLNWNRDTRWARVRAVRLRYDPLKPRLTIFVTPFPPEAERFLELPKSDELRQMQYDLSSSEGLITNHDI